MRQFTLAGYLFRPTLSAMNKLCILAGTTIVSYVGWYLGELLGLEFWGCFLLSSVGSLVGVWVGWKVARKFD
jgi:uncharacterized membrane protein YfcA